MLPDPDFTRDRRGWFYRALAPDPICTVLEVGEAFASSWFSDVVRCKYLATIAADTKSMRFDMVLLHHSFGGCATLKDAIECAHGLLRQGGVLIVAGKNRIGTAYRRASPIGRAPRATGWGFRAAMSGAGFKGVVLYTIYPNVIAPVHIVCCDRLSAREFFRGVFRLQARPLWSPKRLAIAALIELNLMPYLQPDFVIFGKKC
jgi:SAM-dependent methyltransferase